MSLLVANKFEEDMSKLAKENNLEFKRCSQYHFHLKGLFLLNIYPTKNTVYVQGTNGKAHYDDLEALVELANGEAELDGIEKGKRVAGRGRRKALWESGVRVCWVCKGEFGSFEDTTLEHKIPLCKGGSNRRDNLALSHFRCNQERGNKLSINIERKENETAIR